MIEEENQEFEQEQEDLQDNEINDMGENDQPQEEVEEEAAPAEQEEGESEESSQDEEQDRKDRKTRKNPAPQWARDLRKRNRLLQQELAELRKNSQNQTKKLGAKPTLESCDYDNERYETSLSDWYAEKAKQDQREAEELRHQENEKVAWQQKLNEFEQKKKALVSTVDDFEDAEEFVAQYLNDSQIALIVNGTDNPANIIYEIGSDPDRAREFGNVKDLARFAIKIGEMQARSKKVSMKTKKPATAPERRVKSSGGPMGNYEKTLERLEKEAAKTGDRTKIIQYKRKMKEGK